MSINLLDIPETFITVSGISRPLTLVHITDSHLRDLDQRDSAIFTDDESQYFHPSSYRRSNLRAAIDMSNSLPADAIIFTGDMMNYPSAANLDEFRLQVERIQSPYLYTLGNHDWHFPSLPWNDQVRAQYYSRFNEFTNDNPAFQAFDLDGIRLLMVDNSNYQVSQEQLSFLKQQADTAKSCFLFMHIPLCLPKLKIRTTEKWREPILIGAEGWTEETRKKWMIRADDPSTTEFYNWILQDSKSNIKAIFSGHVHFDHEEPIGSSCTQYVTNAGYDGGCRIIRIVPVALFN
ncbi:metallophosphoesterase family protein [Paenibacillus koleovorans]|uniref:metallophosphoesterase family protein n=1 Tax=Paenibacillus koleovorans TaxID=121608 RepID=UPI0013E2A05F|nr:metallophosphoesterase [Paenibacillus koleovorans]